MLKKPYQIIGSNAGTGGISETHNNLNCRLLGRRNFLIVTSNYCANSFVLKPLWQLRRPSVLGNKKMRNDDT
jgi:hypothetical protein